MNLEAKNITVSYGGNVVLDDATHTFREGRIIVVLGPNGCGKTTLIKALVKKFSNTGKLAYIPQEIYGNVGLTVRETVALGRYNKARFLTDETEEDRKHIDSALELMELSDKQHRIYDTLSGGEKQRAMAARAVCQDAEWFIMDEPSSNLDIVHTKHILDTAVKLVKEQGKSFIIVMHDINDAARYGDEFVLMKEGRIIKVCGALDTELLTQTYGTSFGEVKTSSGKTIFYAT